jgi:hypothetical protein
MKKALFSSQYLSLSDIFELRDGVVVPTPKAANTDSGNCIIEIYCAQAPDLARTSNHSPF